MGRKVRKSTETPVEERIALFWSHVEKRGDCWEWTAKITRDGYGCTIIFGKARSAHRVAYEIETGDDANGFLIMHTCDNKPCCNPAHLVKGTQIDNMQDCKRKGRQMKHCRSNRVMTTEKANQFRDGFRATNNKHELSRKYGITTNTVRAILRNEIWRV